MGGHGVPRVSHRVRVYSVMGSLLSGGGSHITLVTSRETRSETTVSLSTGSGTSERREGEEGGRGGRERREGEEGGRGGRERREEEEGEERRERRGHSHTHRQCLTISYLSLSV